MNWMTQLADGVKNALSRNVPCKVAVHSQAQAELGQRAAQRLAGERADILTFVVIPDGECEQYPVGAILVP